jgi:hypothetical protein
VASYSALVAYSKIAASSHAQWAVWFDAISSGSVGLMSGSQWHLQRTCVLRGPWARTLCEAHLPRSPVNLQIMVAEPCDSKDKVFWVYISDQEVQLLSVGTSAHLQFGRVRDCASFVLCHVDVVQHNQAVQWLDQYIVIFYESLAKQGQGCAAIHHSHNFLCAVSPHEFDWNVEMVSRFYRRYT